MLRNVTLSDKYDLDQPDILLTGTQAIVRAILMQKAHDLTVGLQTGGYISGYRGSPLGGLDQQVEAATAVLTKQDIHFNPGINEDLAATAIWGTQQAEIRGDGRLDGVVGLWYGKGPGVDRSGDALRHANLAGSARNGGVIALMGDDHLCESSTTAHHSEYAFIDAMMPILHPAGVQEVLDYCLLGWQMSRYTGCWIGLKLVKDTVESTAVINGSPSRITLPAAIDHTLPEGGLNIRTGDNALLQEARLIEQKIPAAEAFVRACAIDRLTLPGGPSPKLGIISTGKSYLDVLQALEELGIDETRAAHLGIRLLKIGCVWPLDNQVITTFAKGIQTILVVEEKRAVIEPQLKQIMFGTANCPTVLGKRDAENNWLFPAAGVLESNHIAGVIGGLIRPHQIDPDLQSSIDRVARHAVAAAQARDVSSRPAHFCAGCPHNTSTNVPDGMRAYAGIGCHYLVLGMERQTDGFTHMGAEGANWIGEELFSTRQHVFQNVGDGTYSHSGLMAIRAAKAAETTVTFKILFNDAVALTGGQAPEGNLSVFSIAKDLAALDVTAIHVVTDEPEKYSRGSFPASVVVHHRDELELVQRKIAKLPGVTAIIYDQTCAAEKRRRRKRGTYPDPDRRVFINDRVCEGCGDCGIVSNCVAIQPKDTFFGRKRKIDQSSCNKDFSCLDGFCPSFVTVEGGSLRKTQHEPVVDKLPDPILPLIQTNYSILVTGVGGTGVVTIGAILAMAAHIEGKGCGVLDMSGLAQKGGAVYSHVRLANSQADLNAIRIGADGADLLLGCDIAVSGTAKTLAALHSDRTNVIANTYELMPGTFTRDGNYSLPVARVIKEIGDKIPAYRQEFFDATRLATELCGDSIASNMLMLGFAYQRGNIPISADAIEQAIELNGTAVAMNKAAFGWGRCAAIDLASVQSRIDATPEHEPASLSETIDRYQAELQQYQSRKYARSYRKIIDTIADKEGDMTAVVLPVVAEQLYRLMAIKDEYEVARLFAADEFKTKLALTFDNWRTLKFHLAPPLLARRDPVHGHLKKREFGAWILPVFNAMSRFRRIRNTVIDPFSYTAERRQERKLLADYQADIAMAQDMLTPDNQSSIAAFLSYPEQIKGFGHVKQAAIKSALHRRDLQLAILHGTDLTAGADVAA